MRYLHVIRIESEHFGVQMAYNSNSIGWREIRSKACRDEKCCYQWLPSKKNRGPACHAKNAEQHLLHFVDRVEGDIQAHIIGLVYLQDTQLLIEILGNVSVCKGRTPTRLRCTVRYRRYDTPRMNFRIKRIWENDQSNLLPASMADYVQQNITFSRKQEKANRWSYKSADFVDTESNHVHRKKMQRRWTRK